MRAHGVMAAALVWLACMVGLAEEDSVWKVESQQRGITVSRRTEPGGGLPSFRGEGVLKGNVLQVLAVILDVREVERWAYGVSQARSVRTIDARTELIYLYSDTPWPVRDRDMVVRRTVDVVRPGEEFTVALRCETGATPKRSGVIRVHDCASNFVVRRVDADTTAVIYEMSLDPEGNVPQWASNVLARTAPFNTLVAIESRASRTQSRYAAFVKRWESEF